MSSAPGERQGEKLLTFADGLDQPPARPTTPSPGEEMHLVTFSLDREEFGIPIRQVREVIEVGDITRVPQAPRHIRGVANLRGRILAVVEIRTLLGLSPAVLTSRSRVVVVEVHDRVLGILVDAVTQVVKLPTAAVAPAPVEVLSPGTDYITGVARWHSRLIVLLDLERALSIHE